MERMLISGGNGFLGSHLVDKAISGGIDVTVVDDLSTSKKRQIPKEATFIKKSIEDFQTSEKFDYVVHLAARPSPEDYMQNPLSTIDSNDIGTRRMLEIARMGKSIFMYTSTSEVYGDPKVLPIPEDYFGYVNPNGVRSCYDESKRFSEALIKAYERQFDLDVRIQRPFNVYGPRIREDGFYGRVIPRFIDQALNGKPLTVHGDGKQTRSYLYYTDWIEATWKFLKVPDAKGEVLNIGAKDEITVLDLAKKIISITDSRSRIVHMEPRAEDPKRRSADSTKAKEVLGWTPRTGLESGLEMTVRWLKDR
ncbi:MAG: GDP-mannose 4,6-dehydratase [Candidatus Micrarchaeota archaeon]|nr:GDP-mannose 4,6-dehydratase [Candidatus Micrarchaeota archaeon]MDE1834223.1 GDP-mannose 4,6-dehydratase [Candidatus Micrarchaeota archaeon]MDE1859599.1 GDP-mannose 4,6-dehydratase [Candidatus Micrarchaeota archaeon]